MSESFYRTKGDQPYSSMLFAGLLQLRRHDGHAKCFRRSYQLRTTLLCGSKKILRTKEDPHERYRRAQGTGSQARTGMVYILKERKPFDSSRCFKSYDGGRQASNIDWTNSRRIPIGPRPQVCNQRIVRMSANIWTGVDPFGRHRSLSSSGHLCGTHVLLGWPSHQGDT